MNTERARQHRRLVARPTARISCAASLQSPRLLRAIVGIRSCGTYSSLDQEQPRTGIQEL
jgi:hypothetical protein